METLAGSSCCADFVGVFTYILVLVVSGSRLPESAIGGGGKRYPLPENRPIQDQVTAEVAMPGKSESEMKLTASTDVVLEQAVRKVSVEEEKTDEVIVEEPEKEESKTIKMKC